MESFYTVLAVVGTILEVLGLASAVHAIMGSRTSQGAIAWAIVLIIFPLVTLPIYWTFGRSRFDGYVKARRVGSLAIHRVTVEAGRLAQQQGLLVERAADASPAQMEQVLERLAQMPFTRHNRIELLVDEDTFAAFFRDLERAAEYILLQYYIVRDDRIGKELKELLIRKARAGVRIFFLFDEIGSYQLSAGYLQELRQAGVDVRSFDSARRNRFQINFRNHRKSVVVDGKVAFTGGVNIGDEYLGRHPKIGPWRDTNVRIEGPAVHAIQLAFVEDWYWATRRLPLLDWQPQAAAEGRQDVLILPSGPADRVETCGLFFVHVINAARHRLWITSPYFVPDLHVTCALQLAALRGVDVRIMLPKNPDHLLVFLSSFSYLDEVERVGVKFYRYQTGFMHHKVILVDDRLAGVGTANLDNRSFRLNFEITAICTDPTFAEQVAAMLERDFAECEQVGADEYARRPLWFKLCVQVARLMSPLQ